MPLFLSIKTPFLTHYSVPVVFKYKNFVLLFIAACLFVVMGWVFSCLLLKDAIARETGLGYGVLQSLLSLFLTVVFCTAIAGSSDIIIDENGISRRIFGKVWRTIQWGNIKIVKTFHVIALGFRSKRIRAFVVCPSSVPSGWSYLSSRITFTENFVNVEQLIELINHYISKHNIKIEVQTNGVKTAATHLEI